MRISELTQITTRAPGIKQRQQQQKSEPGAETLGKGVFGTVYTKPRDVETAVKISTLNQGSWDADGYYNYIERVKDLKADTHNPYLPQIYDVERVEVRGKKPYLVVEIERLYPTKSLSSEEAELVFQNIIGRPITKDDRARIQTASGRHWRTGEPNPINWIWAARNVMQSIIKQGDWGIWNDYSVKNPELKAALDIVADLVKQGYVLDLHDENYMVRRTPYGVQPVLTDPISFKDPSKIKLKSV